jgi:hypothetical protein
VICLNLRENMDDAFTRRPVRCRFHFPTRTGARLADSVPQDAPVSPDVDYGYLAREFEVAEAALR